MLNDNSDTVELHGGSSLNPNLLQSFAGKITARLREEEGIK